MYIKITLTTEDDHRNKNRKRSKGCMMRIHRLFCTAASAAQAATQPTATAASSTLPSARNAVEKLRQNQIPSLDHFIQKQFAESHHHADTSLNLGSRIDSDSQIRQLLSQESIPDQTPALTHSKVFIETYGCQQNMSDSEIAMSILQAHGYTYSPRQDDADVILLNTCSIREKAESKVWQRLKDIRAQWKRKRDARLDIPKPIVGVLGCMAERLKQDLLEEKNLVDIVVGPDAYRDLPNLLASRRLTGQAAMNVQLSLDETYADIAPVRFAQSSVSAFLSIQRGCNNLCSFCIVPFTRGRERSRPASSILDEVRRLSDQGFKEVVLVGQNVNNYADRSVVAETGDARREEEMASLMKASPRKLTEGFKTIWKENFEHALRFADLLDMVSQVDPNMRVRFTSPHPQWFPDELLQVIRDRHNVCKSLHLPAQSGSTVVLATMKRGYSREAYDALLEKARSMIPDLFVSTDLISGFCGETEVDHQHTLDLLRKSKFDKAYMFHYSLREKTHASRHLKDDVPLKVKLRRLQEVVETFQQVLAEKSDQYVNRSETILVDGHWSKRAEFLQGCTDGGRHVVFDPSLLSDVPIRVGDFVRVKIIGKQQGAFMATPLRRVVDLKNDRD